MSATTNQQVLEAVLRLRDEMSQHLDKPKQAVRGLGIQFEATQKTATAALGKMHAAMKPVSASAQGVGESFEVIDKASAKLIARSTNLVSKLFGLSTVSNVLTDRLGKSELGHSIKTATDALQVFGGVVSVMPNHFGLAVGAAAGLAVGLSGLLEPSEQVRASLEKLNKELEGLRKHRDMIGARSELNKIEDSARAAAGFGASDVDRAKRDRDMLLEKLVGLQRELDVMVRNPVLQEGDESGKLSTKKLAEMRAEIERTEEALKKANQELTEFERVAADKKAVDDFTKSIDALNKKSNEAADAMDAGILEPAKEAAEQLAITDQKMRALFNIKDKLPAGQFDQFKAMFMHGRDGLQARVDAGKASEESERERQRSARQQQHEQERRALRELENEWSVAVPKAMETYLDQLKTGKDFVVEMLDGLQNGLTNMFSAILSGGKSVKDAFKNLAKDLKASMLRTISEMLSTNIMKQFAGLFAMGGTASAAVPTVDARGGGGAGGNGINVGSITSGVSSALGMSSATLGAVAGLGVAGAALTVGGIQGGNATQSTIGGAMAGAAIGTAILPGIGTAVGAIIGGVAGWIGGSRAKRKAKRKRQEAERRAREAYEAAMQQARVVLKQDIRNRLGGGLATMEAAAEIGQLFSGDLSAEEIQKFGSPEQIAANAGAVNRQTSVNVGGITVNAQVSGSYDVARLAEELSYHLQNQMGAAAR